MPGKLSEVILILVGSTLIIMMLIALIITTLFINQKRKFRHNLQLADLKNEYERELLKSQLEIQSQTFETISRELHDNAGTLLSIAMVHLQTGKVSEVTELLNEAMDLLRDISRSLKSETITRNGWQHAFENDLDRIARTKLFSISKAIKGEPFEINSTRQIILFRILQETMNNIVRHSHATNVSVDVCYNGKEMNITIGDNGKGIQNERTDGSGLRNMKARAAMLPAIFNISSDQGKGTTVAIRYTQQENDKV
jgi:signal transduction histidine kinase